MGNSEAAALLIRNIGMFEQTLLLMDEVGAKVKNAISEKINDWVENNSDEWLYQDEIWELGKKSFYHRSCLRKIDDGESPIAYFGITLEGDEEDKWWLASCCGKGKYQFGIFFEVDHGILGVTQSKFRKYLQDENERHYPKLNEMGWKFQFTYSGWWFLRFQLDSDKLATSFAEGAIEDALGPIAEALDKVKAAWPEFKRLADATEKKFQNADT